jgi:glycosyltransferase involved in cell wall biosynthesis
VLVITGYSTDYEGQLRTSMTELGLKTDVRFAGWVSNDDLNGLYRLATCLVFPSLYEGFGLPVIEAMARGLPVACADRSSLPELAGGAALLFDPEQPSAIAGAIETLLGNAALADRLRAGGIARAAEFTWEACARATVASVHTTSCSRFLLRGAIEYLGEKGNREARWARAGGARLRSPCGRATSGSR